MPHEPQRVAESQTLLKRVSKIGMILAAILFLLGLTLYFFSGRAESAETTVVTQATVLIQPPVQEFTLQAGELRQDGPLVGPGMNIRVWSNKPFQVVTRPTGSERRDTLLIRAGYSGLDGREPKNFLWMRGIENGTVVRLWVYGG
ncbi:MAG: hypothetical protein UY23_C0001G0203 [Candidatus Jorgensenbacteria bacterium GW2011_GWA1_48_11]|uniref:Uncharacterized protein n=1 Tax=Candidatus Jorgensenbacteria bacterium GW2011_GWA1_48_11 TaxID=1618660 RepID=A0A0G1UBV4_9BACT|nr:MAG: hypothetical protein UY23_C0001G0203 [Candidatus Jorgensenbacteria bacterium GW2011_GWA1_48_11]KKW12089.1 MAG: hypothetical protein UY51_C0005G0331 [Candidatus Jorgensenbacteria bacterium GW2011_GWB1_49_9]